MDRIDEHLTREPDTTYNGWSNFPTWNVKLWLDNDQGIYNHFADTIPTMGDQPYYDGGPVRERVFVIADWLKEFVENELDLPEMGMGADLTGWALAQVNWLEIAQSYTDDYPFAGGDDDDNR